MSTAGKGERIGEVDRESDAARQTETLGDAPVGLAVLDRELRIVSVSRRLAELNGLEPGVHAGRSV